jgi:arsenate reductase
MDAYAIYGIKNCDTVKKALNWLKTNNIAYEFHDYKSKGITEHKIQSWVNQVGWEELINKKGTTWRQLDDVYKGSITNEAAAISLMLDKTSIIRRPIIEHEGKLITIGFDEQEYKEYM